MSGLSLRPEMITGQAVGSRDRTESRGLSGIGY